MSDQATRPPISSTVAATWALFIGVLLLMAGNGLQGSLLGVRSTTEGFDTIVIGVIMAGYFAGFLIGSKLTFDALSRVGHIRVFAALASSASVAVLLHSVWVNPATWVAMRFATGFCMAGLFVVAESWINDQAGNEFRGRLLSMYMVVAMGGKAGGQLLLNAADPSGFELFVLASAMVSLSLVPMTLSVASAPPVVTPEPMPLRDMWSVVPSGLISAFIAGLASATMGGLAAVYGTQVGMSTAQVSLFVGASLVGAFLFQIPIGSVSDRLPRRKVMLATTTGASAVAVVAALGPETGWQPVVAMFVFGGLSYPLYGLAIAFTNDWVPAERRAGAATVLVMTAGVGAIFGPLVGAVVMNATDPAGFFWTLAVVHGGLGVYLLARILLRPPVPIERQSRFAPFPERATATILARVAGRRSNRP